MEQVSISGSASGNFSRLGCTLSDRYRQDASSFASFVSSRREGRGKPRGSGVNELKEEGSSNQSSRDGFSLNVLRGNRVCYLWWVVRKKKIFGFFIFFFFFLFRREFNRNRFRVVRLIFEEGDED